MVLKGTKRSLRTGNTLRNRDVRANKRSSSVIVRHAANFGRRQETDIADDSFLTADAVQFSLNKKGRWNLPDIIEDNILYNDFDASNDVRVSVLRRHHLNRQNDCVSVTTNVEEFTTPQRKKAHRKTYCNGLNVLHNGRGKSTRDTRKKRVISTAKQKAQREENISEISQPEPQPTPTPEVRYDVFYPVPATSSLRFNRKFAASTAVSQAGSDIEQRLVCSSGLRSGNYTHQRHRGVSYDDMYHDDEYSDYSEDEEGYGEDDYYGYGEDCFTACEEDESEELSTAAYSIHTTLFSDIVEHALALASSPPAGPKQARRPKRFAQPGGRFFYQPETEGGFDSCLEDGEASEASTDSSASSSVSPPQTSAVVALQPIADVTVRLASEATSRAVLTEQYGSAYSEAACLPRKVVIDITDRVRNALARVSSFTDLHLPSMDLTSYVIFTYICPDMQTEDIHDTCPQHSDMAHGISGDYDVFRVQLNMNCLGRGFELSLPGESLKFNSVEDVITQLLDFIATLSPEVLARKASEASPCALEARLKPDFDTLAEVNGWTVSCLSLLDATPKRCVPANTQADTDQETHCRHQESTKKEEARPHAHMDEPISEDGEKAASGEIYCGICFEDIFSGSLKGPYATALRQCGHWFCDTCWQSHLAVATREGVARKLQCPEFRCDVEVDPSTLLSLLHVRDVLAQQRRRVEVAVTKRQVCKWCPNPQCGRVVLLAAAPAQTVSEPTSMSCPCGKRFCYLCHGDPHWPMSCSDYSVYSALLRKNDRQLAHLTEPRHIVEVRGKNCPKCNRFMIREGGCPFMTCLCRHTFWWCCRKSTSERHDCPSIMTVTDITNTMTKIIRQVDTAAIARLKNDLQQSTWYSAAVRHRAAQQPRKAKQDQKRAQKLREKLLALADKGVHIGLPLTLTKDGEVTAQMSGSPVSALSKPEKLLSSPGRDMVRQHVKQTTTAMTKLKLEIHSVLENTAAVLHLQHERAGSQELSRPTVNRVKNTVERITFLAASLHLMLDAQGPQDVRRVLPGFRRLQRETKESLTTLARLLNSSGVQP